MLLIWDNKVKKSLDYNIDEDKVIDECWDKVIDESWDKSVMRIRTMSR